MTSAPDTHDLLAMLAGKWEAGRRPADLYESFIAARPSDYLPALLTGLAGKDKRVKGACAEILSRVSESHPAIVYPHLELFVKSLAAKEPILRWEAVCTVGHLATVDARKAIAPHVPVMVSLLADKSIVLQGHAVRALGKVAVANPTLAPAILRALIASVKHFPGTRVGYIVEAMESFASIKGLTGTVKEFLEPYCGSEHAPVARKANKAMKKVAR
jgi:HEAT repeat protein